MKQIIKNTAINLMHFSGMLSNNIEKKSQGQALILAYHHIIKKDDLDKQQLMPGMYLSKESFQTQIEWLKINFKLVPLSKITSYINKKKKWTEPLCAITFDDGWQDIYQYAFPILKEYIAPATVFLVGNNIEKSAPNCWDICFEIFSNINDAPKFLTNNIDINKLIKNNIKNKQKMAVEAIRILRQLSYNDFRKVCDNLEKYYYDYFDVTIMNKKYSALSPDNIKEMARHHIDFGYHSKGHYMLTNLPKNKIDMELNLPTEQLEKFNIALKPLFCYPDGKYNKNVIRELLEKNYIGAVSLAPGFNNVETNPFILRRVNLHQGNSSTIPQFLASIGIFNR